MGDLVDNFTNDDIEWYIEVLDNIVDFAVEEDYSEITQYINPIEEMKDLLRQLQRGKNEGNDREGVYKGS